VLVIDFAGASTAPEASEATMGKGGAASPHGQRSGKSHKTPLPVADNERFLQLVFDGITDGLCVLDTDFNILLANEFMERLYESEMPLVGKKCYEAYHRSSTPCEVCPSLRALKTGKFCTDEIVYRTGGRDAGWLELSAFPLTDETGHVAGIVEYIKNVTDRKKAECALRASEEKYRRIFNNALVGLFRTRIKDGLVIEANDSFARMHGYANREEIIGKAAMANSYVDGTDREKLINACLKANGPVGYESQRYKADGTVFWVRGSAKINVKEDCFEGVATDITAQKMAEDTLRLTQFAVDNGVDAAYWLDADGRFVYVNNAACRMYGYTRGELLAMKITETDVDRSTRGTWTADWNEGRSRASVTVVREKRRKDGTTFPAELTTKHVVFSNVEYRCVFARDVTDRQALEEQLRQAQKMEAVGRLAGGVAHDFNNILQGILGTAELALADTPEGDKLHTDLMEIRRGAQRAAELTNQLLAFSRRQMLQSHEIDINGIVEDTVHLLHRVLPESISINMVLAKPLLAVSADRTQMQQVILNLCLNARDAMPKGGTLTIETGVVDITEAYCQTNLSARPGRYVRLCVSDNGVGMDEKTLSHVFEPFFTTKEVGRGTGLGLATAYGIVKQHNGMITAYSEPGNGTVIKVYLPAVEREVPVSLGRPSEVVPGGTETILIAEDQQTSKDLARKVLERNGYRVIAASDGKQALRLFNENAKEIDLVFLDLVMPGMSGHEAFMKMREIKPGLKAVFTTGYSVNAVESNVADCSGLTVIAKPYTSSDVLRVIRKALDGEA
jgi:two-component system, cell cycle sensor histidine kinase and response regulator CckA